MRNGECGMRNDPRTLQFRNPHSAIRNPKEWGLYLVTDRRPAIAGSPARPANAPPLERPLSHHPYADLIGLVFEDQRSGHSRCTLNVAASHLNPHGVVHGAVLYSLADTGMGAALYPTLQPGEICATIEIKINYFKPVVSGTLTCVTELVNRGKTVANLESRVQCGDVLVAKANGNYSIFRPGKAVP